MHMTANDAQALQGEGSLQALQQLIRAGVQLGGRHKQLFLQWRIHCTRCAGGLWGGLGLRSRRRWLQLRWREELGRAEIAPAQRAGTLRCIPTLHAMLILTHASHYIPALRESTTLCTSSDSHMRFLWRLEPMRDCGVVHATITGAVSASAVARGSPSLLTWLQHSEMTRSISPYSRDWHLVSARGDARASSSK